MHLITNTLSNLSHVLKRPRFWPIALSLKALYFYDRLMEKSKLETDSALTYGRTPLSVFELIHTYMKPSDTFLDLGCGEGLGLFYLNHVYGMKTIGIDLRRSFIETAHFVTHKYHIPKMEFIQADLSKARLPEADVVFVAGTCFSEGLLEIIAQDLNQIRPRVIVSISAPLSDYGLKNYKVEEIPIRMDFGKTTLFIHR
jgi:SAM-dependent methyltransferase